MSYVLIDIADDARVGGGLLFFRLLRKNRTTAMMSPSPTIPPTTPPVIAPTLVWWVGAGRDVEPAPVLLGVLALATEAVTSG